MSEHLITSGIGSATHIKNIECVRRGLPLHQQQPTPTLTTNVSTNIGIVGLKEQMTTRCVIVHRDERGFGLRVSGDNPVFVDSVRDDGAAYKAGVRAGDRIIKVNGTLVTKHNHSEVVKMIQDCGTYVALQLLGLKQSMERRREREEESKAERKKEDHEIEENNVTLRSNVSSGGRMRDSQTFDCLSSHITAPLPANNVTLREFEKTKKKTIEAMLEKEFQYLKKLQGSKKNDDNMIRQVSERIKKLQEQLRNAKRLIGEDGVSVDAGGDSEEKRRCSLAGMPRGGYGQRRHLSAENLDLFVKEGGKKDKKGGRKSSKGEKKGEEKSHSFNQFDSRSKNSNAIISMESEEDEEEESGEGAALRKEDEDEKEPSLESLTKESFVLKFLYFLLIQGFPLSSTCFLILISLYKKGVNSHKLSASTRRRWCFELYSTFLLPDSPLHFLEHTQESELNRVDNQLNNRRGGKGEEINESKEDESEEAKEKKEKDAFLNIFEYFESRAKKETEKYIDAYKHQQLLGLLYCPRDRESLIDSIFSLILNLEPSDTNPVNYVQHIQHLLHNMNNQSSTSGNVPTNQSSPPPPVLSTTSSPLSGSTSTTSGTVTLSSLPPSSSVILAQITCMVTILKHMYLNNQKSKELRQLASFFQTKDQQVYQSHQGFIGKRYKSLPGSASGQTKEEKSNEFHLLGSASFSGTTSGQDSLLGGSGTGGVYICAGHSFVSITKTMVIYCSGCGHVIWGGPAFGKECATCFLHVHSWCLKETAEESPCLLQQSSSITIGGQSGGPNQHQSGLISHSSTESTGGSGSLGGAGGASLTSGGISGLLHHSGAPGRKSRTKWRTSGGRIVDNFLKKTGLTGGHHFAQSQTSLLLSSQHSLDQQEPIEGTISPLLLSSETDSDDSDFMQFSERKEQQTGSNQATITRSESLKQRKKENKNKECLRKRSDPALVSSYKQQDSLQESRDDSENETENKENKKHDKEEANDVYYQEIEAENDERGKDDELKEGDEEEEREDEELPEPKVPPPPLPMAPSVVPPPLPPRNKCRTIVGPSGGMGKEKVSNKRVDVVKELFKTEQRHVKNLRVLHQLFFRPISQESLMPFEQISVVFANHEELLAIHSQIHLIFKNLKKERDLDYERLSSILLEIFDGQLGEKLASSASLFCSTQANGGQETLRQRIKKDSKLASFLQEAESHSKCKRLQLKDILASCFQRITKYPLLLESLLKATPTHETKSREQLERALRRSREILSEVNESVKRAENKQRLLELQKQIQADQAKELQDKELVFEGDLVWRITKQKQIDVRVVLCTDTLFVLTKEDRDKWKFSLRSQLHPTTKTPLRPVLHVKDLLTRDIATDQRAFFVVSKMENVLYEFAASSSHERKLWTEKIEKIVLQNISTYLSSSPYKKSKLKDLTRSNGSGQSGEDVTSVQTKENGAESEREEGERSGDLTGNSTTTTRKDGEEEEEDEDAKRGEGDIGGLSGTGRIEGTIRFVSSDEEEEELHSAKELNVKQLKVEEAVRVVTDEEKIRIIDEQINNLLQEKKRLILNIFGVSDEKEWKIIEDISQSDSSEFVQRLPVIEKSLEMCTRLTLRPNLHLESDLEQFKQLIEKYLKNQEEKEKESNGKKEDGKDDEDEEEDEDDDDDDDDCVVVNKSNEEENCIYF